MIIEFFKSVRRTIVKPKFNLNRNERRALERGKRILARCHRGENFALTLERGLELNKANVKAQYVRLKEVK